jgi:GNAT superfamily N-acetyltransferase
VGEQLRVRVATHDDVEAMTGLLQALFAIETDFDFRPDKTRRGLEMLLARPEQGLALVVDDNGKVVGMGTLQLLVSTAEGGVVGLVEDIVIDESRRGRGLGRLLLQSLEQWAVARGASRLQLLADRHNRPALAFYAALGWSATELVALRRKLDTSAVAT